MKFLIKGCFFSKIDGRNIKDLDWPNFVFNDYIIKFSKNEKCESKDNFSYSFEIEIDENTPEEAEDKAREVFEIFSSKFSFEFNVPVYGPRIFEIKTIKENTITTKMTLACSVNLVRGIDKDRFLDFFKNNFSENNLIFLYSKALKEEDPIKRYMKLYEVLIELSGRDHGKTIAIKVMSIDSTIKEDVYNVGKKRPEIVFVALRNKISHPKARFTLSNGKDIDIETDTKDINNRLMELLKKAIKEIEDNNRIIEIGKGGICGLYDLYYFLPDFPSLKGQELLFLNFKPLELSLDDIEYLIKGLHYIELEYRKETGNEFGFGSPSKTYNLIHKISGKYPKKAEELRKWIANNGGNYYIKKTEK
ncbi:hypothetical protein M0Q39_05675 [Patescibacteria group bacterium]|nr:hypothetical protein [Patescibacteria group bacterium]